MELEEIDLMNQRVRWMLLIVLMAMCIILSGCFQGEMKVKIHENGSADVEYKMLTIPAAEKAVLGEVNRFNEMGFQVQRITEDESIGFKGTKSISAVEALNQYPIFSGVDGKPGIDVSRGWFYDNYEINILTNMKKVSPALFENMKQPDSPIWSSFSMKILMSFPSQPSSNNATNLHDEGKTLEWVLNFTKDNQLKAQAKFWHIEHVVITLVLPLFVAGFLFSKRKKADQDTTSKMAKIHPIAGGVAAMLIIAIAGMAYSFMVKPVIPNLMQQTTKQETSAPAPAPAPAVPPAPAPTPNPPAANSVDSGSSKLNLKLLYGKWASNGSGPESLYLNFDFDEANMFGTADGTTNGGKRMDKGKFQTSKGDNVVKWTSSFGGNGTAKIEMLNEYKLRWTIINGQGQYYLPQSIVLQKQ